MKNTLTNQWLNVVCLAINISVSSGKSAVINALLERDILSEGIMQTTLCIAKCQPSLNNEEYFEIYTGNVRSNQPLELKEIKLINQENPSYLKFSMNFNNHLDIYLNIPSNNILHNFLLIDCPGFGVNNLEAISKYCDNADIIVFCFRAKDGITDRDIEKIKQVKSKIGNFQINFIINCFDECDSINRAGIINRLSPHLTGEDAIFFISALEEKIRMFNDATRLEFERLKECLQKQNSLEAAADNNIYLALICSINNLLNCMRSTNYQEHRFIDTKFRELQQTRTSYIDKTKPGENESDETFADSSDIVNKETTEFIIRQFINDYNLNDGIIDENCSPQLSFDKDANKLLSSWLEFDENSEEMKLSRLLSALEEKVRMLNDERHREFEKFKQCLQKQKSLATVTYRKVYGDLLHSVKELLDSLKFTNFRESRFSERKFEELYEKIVQLINNDKIKYYKNDIKGAISSYSSQANKEISKFMMKQFIIDHNLNDGIIDDNCLFKRLLQNDAISEPNFSWFEFGDKSSEMKKSFVDYFISKLTTNQQNIEEHYRERVQTILIELEDYKNKLNEIIENIKKIMF